MRSPAKYSVREDSKPLRVKLKRRHETRVKESSHCERQTTNQILLRLFEETIKAVTVVHYGAKTASESELEALLDLQMKNGADLVELTQKFSKLGKRAKPSRN